MNPFSSNTSKEVKVTYEVRQVAHNRVYVKLPNAVSTLAEVMYNYADPVPAPQATVTPGDYIGETPTIPAYNVDMAAMGEDALRKIEAIHQGGQQ